MIKKALTLLLLGGFAGIVTPGGAPGFAAAPDTEAVLKPVRTFTAGLGSHDFAAISSAWHANGRLFIVENIQTVDFLKGIPPFVRFEFDEPEVLSVDGRIAVVKLGWRMIMPKTVGQHKSYLNLVEENGRWLIISETDFGVEKEP